MHLPRRYLLPLLLPLHGLASPVTSVTTARTRSLDPSSPPLPVLAPQKCASGYQDLDSSSPPVPVPAPQKRAPGHQTLGNGLHLTYQTFSPFAPTHGNALALSVFWTEIAIQITNPAWMPDAMFGLPTFKLKMPLEGVTLVFEMISVGGVVTRDFVKDVTAAMMEYTLRGFCGVFNAVMRRTGEGGAVWIVLRVVEGGAAGAA